MKEKSLNVQGYWGDFRVVLDVKICLRICQKYLSVHGEYAEDKRIWRMRQEYFSVYGEYGNQHKIELISANFCPN
jgi:hypothetical protein